MLFTRASCQAAFDASNTTLTLLGLDRQLPWCAFCSLADALEAAPHNPLAFLHLANQRTLCLVLQCHGPFGQLAQLGSIVHEGVREVVALLAVHRLAGNVRAISVERRAGELLVRVEVVESTEPKQVYVVKLDFVSERTIKDHHHHRDGDIGNKRGREGTGEGEREEELTDTQTQT